MVNLFLQKKKENRNRLRQIEERETKLRKDYQRQTQRYFFEKKIQLLGKYDYRPGEHCNVTLS